MTKLPPIRALIINPNTSQHMTDALVPVVETQGYENITYTYFTSPSPGIPSINSDKDAAASAEICLPAILSQLHHHDIFLIACYSAHPLVPSIQSEISKQNLRGKYVAGIFETSIATSLLLTSSRPSSGFAIVSTGKVWESILQTAVDSFLGTRSDKFLGCQTTGLNAAQLHELPASQVQSKMKDATKKVFGVARQRGINVGAICLGCAGMVGLEEAVRQACVEEVGEEEGRKVAIVDGVKAGVGQLVSLYRCGF